VVSTPEAVGIGQDKLRTARWLEGAGLGYPRSAAGDDPEGVEALLAATGLPLVVKPRRGKGADAVAVVRTREELEHHAGRAATLVQEHLPDGAEYTVGCMSDTEGLVRGSVVMRRELADGTTVVAEMGEFPEVRAEATAIAEALRPRGPLNVQLRVRDGRPVAFELNVRFSGTTPMRARAGFNEVEAALRHFVLGEPLTLPEVGSGTVLRYWNEMYVPAAARDALTGTGRLDDPWAQPVVVEDWGIRR
jgi:carbamoyl-phosphate synthase large subunit